MDIWIERIMAAIALFGGLVLVTMAGVTCASVLGRAVPWVPQLRGDIELIELGCAIAVFSFLPWCQLNRGQVSVDLVSLRFGARGHAILGLIGNAVLTLVALVILWRFWPGLGDLVPFGPDRLRQMMGLGPAPSYVETTFDLMIPVWIPRALCLPGAVGLVVSCAFTTWRSWGWVRAGGEPS